MIHNKKELMVHFVHMNCLSALSELPHNIRERKVARAFKAVSVIASSIIAVGLSAGSAHAVFINGSVGLGDAGITLSNLPGSMVSALTSMTLGSTAVPGPCTMNFVGCNANAPGTTLTLPLVSGAMTGLFSTPVGGTPFMWTFGTIAGSVIRTAPVNIGGNLITDSIQFIATGSVDDGPGGFDPTFAIINFNASGNCIGTGISCNAGTATATWQATLSAAGTPTQVPEPATIALLGFGLAGLGISRRKKA